MASYISPQEFQENKNDFRNHNSNEDLNKEKRKRIAHFLVDKPLGYPFPIEHGNESLLSIGGA